MMGYTDRHYRKLLRLISPNAVLYTEMVVASALTVGNATSLLTHGDDAPCVLQLGGNDPRELAQAAKLGEAAGYQAINLNVGCPSDRVQSGTFGACLMAQPALVADCIAAMQDAVTVPVTVKTRIGIAERHANHEHPEDFEFFRHFVETVHAAGCRTFIIHARKAILSGLSPRENREIPPLRYDFVYRIREAFTDATFILNGGLKTVDAVTDALSRVDGVMLGRIACSNPLMLADLEVEIFQNRMADRLSILADYRDYIDQQMHEGENFRHMVRHLLGLFNGCTGARAFRRHLSEHMTRDDAGSSLIDDALQISGVHRQAIPTGT